MITKNLTRKGCEPNLSNTLHILSRTFKKDLKCLSRCKKTHELHNALHSHIWLKIFHKLGVADSKPSPAYPHRQFCYF